MRVVLLATTARTSGGTFYARKLADRLPATVLPAERPIPALVVDLLRRNADVVHIEAEYATLGGVARTLLFLPVLVLVRRLRGPVVLTFHGVVSRESARESPFPRLVHAAFRASTVLCATFASAVTVHSEGMRDALAAEYGVADAVVVPHGSDGPPVGARQPLPRHILFFGFLRPSKGIEALVEAVRLLRPSFPNVHLTVAGGTLDQDPAGYFETLQGAVARAGCADCVVLRRAFLSEAEKDALVRASEVLALPYTDAYVEVSGVVHDLMAGSLPMVVSDRPRFSELTDGVDCLKVPPEPRALATAIRSLFEDPALAERLAARLREEAASESWDLVAERYRRLYEGLGKARRAPRQG